MSDEAASPASLGVEPLYEFSIGDVFVRGFELFLRSAVPFTILGGTVMAPYDFAAVTRLDYILPIRDLLPTIDRMTAAYFRLSTIASFLLAFLSEGLILAVALQYLDGGRINLRRAISTGFKCFPVLAGIGAVRSLWLNIGYPLIAFQGTTGKVIGASFVALGLTLTTRWFVAPSVAVAEDRGVWASLGRCATLTREHRWKVLGILLLTLVPYLIIAAFLPRLYLSLGMIWYLALISIFHGMYVGFGSAVGAVIYQRLKLAKDGPSVGSLAAVFN